MNITLSKGKYAHSYTVTFTKEVLAQLQRKEVVFFDLNDTVFFREAMLSDKKTWMINKSNKQTTYTTYLDCDFIGMWTLKKEGDIYCLDKKIKEL